MTKDEVLLIRAESGAGDGRNVFGHAATLFARDRGISVNSAARYIAEKFPEFYKKHFSGQ